MNNPQTASITRSDLELSGGRLTPLEKFREYLETKGMRMTQERSMIVEEVFADHEHFEADELVARLSTGKGSRKASRATVYRTLGQLVDSSLLRKVARPNDREVYEHDYGYPQHDHLICKSCGELIEFHNDDITAIVEKVAAEKSFRIQDHRLEVYGLCAKCSLPKKGQYRKLDRI